MRIIEFSASGIVVVLTIFAVALFMHYGQGGIFWDVVAADALIGFANVYFIATGRYGEAGKAIPKAKGRRARGKRKG
ncbi:MAG: hypothetical protein M1448_04075 [Candidatus Marsarchaeota archaeon]|jgi:hypothetical protein|nr:hypothetical protein [Candidatus Marsarchaeota archaeon]